MGFEFYKESYTGAVRTISLGKGEKAVTVGGETCYPFYSFEGKMPHKPKIAMEIWDMEPEEWPEAALINFKDVISDPAAWAKKCVESFGAELIVLQLKSTDPNGKNASAEAASATVKKVLAAIKVPLIIWGCSNFKKDEEVLKKIAEDCKDLNLVLGPVEEKNHKGIGASAIGYGHSIISSSPIDVNLAKQVNILLENLGMPMDRIICDPTTGGLGYGLEYSYSVMERLRMAALTQGDDKLQYPVINNLGNEVWKCKEAKESATNAPLLGDPERRGILMEATCAISYLMAGSDILIMRHPEAIKMVKNFINLLCDGGSAKDVAGIKKQLAEVNIDLKSLAPAPNLKIEEEKKAAAPAKKVEAEKKPASEPAKAAAPTAPKVEEKPKAVEQVKVEADNKAKADIEAKAKLEADNKAKIENEAKLKAQAEAEAKQKAEADKIKAENEAKAKAEEEKKAKALEIAKRDAEEDALRQKRAKEREERQSKRGGEAEEKISMTPAAQQRSELDWMMERLNRTHRR